ncbi:hypothetical protein PanWU01x14_131770, partial [Parasponia andersonii]
GHGPRFLRSPLYRRSLISAASYGFNLSGMRFGSGVVSCIPLYSGGRPLGLPTPPVVE